MKMLTTNPVLTLKRKRSRKRRCIIRTACRIAYKLKVTKRRYYLSSVASQHKFKETQ